MANCLSLLIQIKSEDRSGAGMKGREGATELSAFHRLFPLISCRSRLGGNLGWPVCWHHQISIFTYGVV